MRIYIAGPMSPKGIRSDNGAIEYALNVRDMVRVATELIKLGHAPFCPGLDFLYFIGASYDKEPTEVEIKAQSLEWLEVADAILMIGEWPQSEGAVVEFEYARLNKIKIYTSLEEILKENAE